MMKKSENGIDWTGWNDDCYDLARTRKISGAGAGGGCGGGALLDFNRGFTYAVFHGDMPRFYRDYIAPGEDDDSMSATASLAESMANSVLNEEPEDTEQQTLPYVPAFVTPNKVPVLYASTKQMLFDSDFLKQGSVLPKQKAPDYISSEYVKIGNDFIPHHRITNILKL